MNNPSYTFHPISNCNLCNSPNYKILGKRLNKSQGYSPKKKTGITTTVVKCTNCNLIYSNPLPIPRDIQDHYGINPKNYWKDEYFTIDENYFKEELEDLNDLINIDSNTKALDIGAGLGKCMIALENNGINSFGIEPSVEFHKMAIEKMKINPEKLQLSTIEDAQFDSNTFDFITFGAVLEHLYDPAHCIKQALNWLKPGGVIQIEVPNSEWLSSKIINFSYKLRGIDYVGNLSPMHSPYHLYEFSIDSFKQFSKLDGSFNIPLYKFFICDTYLPKIFDPILKPLMRNTNTGMQLVVWLRKQ